MNNPQELIKQVSKPKGIRQMIESAQMELGKALPDSMSAERFTRIAMTCGRLNPELFDCTPESFMGALFTSAQLGIEPIAGHAYLIPFSNSKKVGGNWVKKKEVQFILGYKGIAALFYRHAKAMSLNWGVVRENDFFDFEQGSSAFLRHKPILKDRGEVMGYWVMAKLSGDAEIFHYMGVDECMSHGKKHSKTFNKRDGQFYASSPWATSPDAMCLKTVLVQLSKLLPISIDLQRAIDADETSRQPRKKIENMLDVPSETNWLEEPEDVSPPSALIDEA